MGRLQYRMGGRGRYGCLEESLGRQGEVRSSRGRNGEEAEGGKNLG